MTAILTVQNVDKAFGTRVVLAGVSFAVDERDRVGIVGLNGAGKSTLLKLVVGADDPDSGLITRQRELTLEYVPQEPALDGALSVGETVRQGLRAHVRRRSPNWRRRVEDSRARAATSCTRRSTSRRGCTRASRRRAAGIASTRCARSAAALQLPPLESKIGTLSGGERRRVALARALLARPALLALDEPTNHLDADTVEWLEERLAREWHGALLLVTHDRYFLDRVATRILELDRGAALRLRRRLHRVPGAAGGAAVAGGGARAGAALVRAARARLDPARAAGAQHQAEGAHRSLRRRGRRGADGGRQARGADGAAAADGRAHGQDHPRAQGRRQARARLGRAVAAGCSAG